MHAAYLAVGQAGASRKARTAGTCAGAGATQFDQLAVAGGGGEEDLAIVQNWVCGIDVARFKGLGPELLARRGIHTIGLAGSEHDECLGAAMVVGNGTRIAWCATGGIPLKTAGSLTKCNPA